MSLVYTVAFIVFLMILAYASLKRKNKAAKKADTATGPVRHQQEQEHIDKAA